MANKSIRYSIEKSSVATTNSTATTLSVSTPQLASSLSTSKKTSTPFSSHSPTDTLSTPLIDSGTDLKEHRKSIFRAPSPRFRSFFSSLPRLNAWNSISILFNGASTNPTTSSSPLLLSNPISLSIDLTPTHPTTQLLEQLTPDQEYLESARHRLAQTWLTFPFPRRSLNPSFWELNGQDVWADDLPLSVSSSSSWLSKVNVLPNIPEDSILWMPFATAFMEEKTLKNPNNNNEKKPTVDLHDQSRCHPRSWCSTKKGTCKVPRCHPSRQRCSTFPRSTSNNFASKMSSEWRRRRCGTFGDQFKWSDSITLEELLNMRLNDEEEHDEKVTREVKTKASIPKQRFSFLHKTKVGLSLSKRSATQKVSEQWEGWIRNVCNRASKK